MNDLILNEIKNHKWFNDFDWDALVKREIEAPF